MGYGNTELSFAQIQHREVSMGEIYKITNKIDNKSYIGQTTQGVNRRWSEHKRDYNKNLYGSLLHKAMREYGIENFEVCVLEKVDNSKLNDREQYWIDYYNTFEDGYNQTTGGSKGCKCSKESSIQKSIRSKGMLNPMYGKTHTEEARRKISVAHKGKKIPPTQFNYFRDGVEKPNFFAGRKHSEETKQKLREINLGKKHTEKSKMKMSLSRRGEKHHNFGKRGRESTRHTTIYRYSKDWVLLNKFDTLAETLQFLGLKGHSDLYKSIKNKTIYKGCYWSKESVETIETTDNKKL